MAAVLLVVELRRHGRFARDDRDHWVLPVIVGLSVGITSVVAQRLLVIVAG